MDSASAIGDQLDSFTILIKNVPEDESAGNETLEEFVKRLSWQENVEIKPTGNKNYFAVFTNVMTDVEQVLDQLKTEAFRGVMLDLNVVKKIKKLHVSGLKSDVTDFEICLYFEQPIFRPPSIPQESFEVTVLNLNLLKHYAIIRIPNDADVHLFLDAKHTNMIGEKIRVSEYRPPKQQETKGGKFSRGNGRAPNYTQDKQRQNRRRGRGQGGPRDASSGSSKNSQWGSQNDLKNLNLVPVPIDELPRDMPPHNPNNQFLPSQVQYSQQQFMSLLHQNIRPLMSYVRPVMPQVQPLLQTPVGFPPTFRPPSHYNGPPTRPAGVPLRFSQPPLQRFHIPPQFPSRHGQGDKMKKEKMANVPNNKDSNHCLDGLPYVTWLNVKEEKDEKCQLFKKFLVNLRQSVDSGWKVWIDKKQHRIGVGHNEEKKLEEVVNVIRNLIDSMISCPLALPDEIGSKLDCGKGYKFLIKFFDILGMKVVFYVHNKRPFMLGEKLEEAQSAAKELENDLERFDIKVNWDRLILPVENFVSKDWKIFLEKLSREHVIAVCVDEIPGQGAFLYRRIIKVTGFKSSCDFTTSVQKVKDKLEEMHSKLASKPASQNKEAKSSGITGPTNEGSSLCESLDKTDSQNKHVLAKETEDLLDVKMELIAYKFFKLHLPNIIDSKCKYMLKEGLVRLKGEQKELNQKKDIIDSVLACFVTDQFTTSLPGITEEFYNEKNSSLRKAFNEFELKYTFAFDVKTISKGDQRQTTITYMYQAGNPNSDSLSELMTPLLNNFVKKRAVSYSKIFEAANLSGFEMSESVANKIKHIPSKHVSIFLDNSTKTMTLLGREHFFDFVEKQVIQMLSKVSTKQTTDQESLKVDYHSSLRRENLPEFLKKIGHEEVYAPDHWTTYKGSLRGVSSNGGHLVEMDPKSQLFNYISDVTIQTWKSGTVGIGRDALNLQHSHMKITKIFSVENVFQFKRYMTRVKEFCLQNSTLGFSGLDCKETKDILTRRNLPMMNLLLWEINECYLFHGTRPEKKQAIIDQGLDFRLGSQGSLFGQGIYFAESSTKADQYADPKQQRCVSGERLYMFLVKVFLGRSHIAKGPRPFKRPPCSDADCCSDTCSKHQLNDSVIGTHTSKFDIVTYNSLLTRRHQLAVSGSFLERQEIEKKLAEVRPLLFREFVVYDQAQCYPEFLIEYIRV